MKDQEKSLESLEVKKALNVDPATAAAAIAVAADVVSVASGLWSLFGKKDSKEILKQLKIIRQQNEKIISLLTQVLLILNNLGVIVRQSVRDEIIVLIKNRLYVALTRFYEVYEVDASTPELAAESARKFAELKPVFADLGRLLSMAGTYGYGHFDAIGLAMTVEDWIAERTGDNKAFRRQSLFTYMTYFEQCVSPIAPNSVGMQLALSNAQRQRFDTVLKNADAMVVAGFASRSTTYGRRSGDTTTNYQTEYRATGNQVSGYRFTSVEVNVGTVHHSEGGQNAGGVGGGTHLTAPDPVDPGGRSVPEKVQYWEAVRKAREAVMNDIRILEASQQNCLRYLQHIESRMA